MFLLINRYLIKRKREGARKSEREREKERHWRDPEMELVYLSYFGLEVTNVSFEEHFFS